MVATLLNLRLDGEGHSYKNAVCLSKATIFWCPRSNAMIQIGDAICSPKTQFIPFQILSYGSLDPTHCKTQQNITLIIHDYMRNYFNLIYEYILCNDWNVCLSHLNLLLSQSFEFLVPANWKHIFFALGIVRKVSLTASSGLTAVHGSWIIVYVPFQMQVDGGGVVVVTFSVWRPMLEPFILFSLDSWYKLCAWMFC